MLRRKSRREHWEQDWIYKSASTRDGVTNLIQVFRNTAKWKLFVLNYPPTLLGAIINKERVGSF